MTEKLDFRVIKPGAIVPAPIEAEKYPTTYEMLRDEIGGTIDVCMIDGVLDIWVDDEGMLKGLSPTILIKRSKKPELTDYDTLLVGPAVFASHNSSGDTISLTEEAIEIINQMQPALLGITPILVLERFQD